MEFFLQLLVNGVCIGLLYGISAMGFVMIFKASSVPTLPTANCWRWGPSFSCPVTWGKFSRGGVSLTLIGCLSWRPD